MAQDVNQSETDIAAQVRSALVAHIGAERFELWIAPETRWAWCNGALKLTFASDFACQLVRRMLGKELGAMLKSIAGPQAELQLEVGQTRGVQLALNLDGDNDAYEAPEPSVSTQPSESLKSAVPSADTREELNREGLISIPFARSNAEQTTDKSAAAKERDAQTNAVRETGNRETNHRDGVVRESTASNPWERFVAGSCNQLAWTSANMVVTEPGRMTPVLFHGPCGVGKSHLITAIAHQLRSRCRMRRVVHMTSEQFTNDFTEAIKGSGLPMFRRKYRDVEALIIDDVHFLIGKKATLGEFKHTIDNLMRLGKQVILTADRSLNDLQSLGNDVVGRLRGALITPLMPIDERTRATLLERELQESSVQVPPEVIQQIASRVVGDGRVLQGIVKRLVAFASQARESLSWEQCWNAVYDLVQATQPVVRLGDIERVVCEVFGLEPTSLQSSSKARTVAQPRMLAMFLARKYTPAAYKEIGDYFGNRRHSTVISAEKTVAEWLRDNTELGDARGLSVRDAIRHVESHLQVG